jgi:hypothetical protein
MAVEPKKSKRGRNVNMAAIAEIRLGEINAKEDLSLRLGDALDVKASIGLALLIFLATQSAYFLDKGLSHIGKMIQTGSIICVCFAIVLALWELWPRTYVLPEPESPVVTKRIEQLTEHFRAFPKEHPDVEMSVANALINDQMQWAKHRIEANQKKNWRKSNLLNWSFWLTIPAIALNLVTAFTLVR